MNEVREEQFCLENRQSDVTSSCSVSDGSCDAAALKSPGVCSPATSSPSHRRTTGPIRRAKGGWTLEEDETLRNAVKAFKGRCWKKIAEYFPDRSEVQCLHRWQKVLNPELIKGPWTQEEDEKIVELVSNYGPTKWSSIAKALPGRIGKQCRERWHNHLNPNIKKDAWTLEEELLLMNAQRVHGNKWAEIAKVLPGRTDNSIKNHWNSSLKKKLDFYLATGRLPPVPKTGQIDAKDISQATDGQNILVCSDKPSDIAADISLSDLCNVERHPKDQLGLMEQSLYADASLKDMLIDPSSGVECKSQLEGCEEKENCSSGSDFSYSNCESTPTSIKFRNDVVTDQENNIAGTPLHCVIPTFGSSYCEPSHSDNHDTPSNGAVFNKLCSFQQTNDSYMGVSSGCITKGGGLGWQSAESILKSAAKSFPNTPSILKRKRKRDLHASVSLDRTKESVDKGNIKDVFQTPEQTERTEKQDQCSSINSSLCESSICHGTVGLSNGRDLNSSPPYRLRSKRTAVFKSVEKQLDFTSEIDKIETSDEPMNVAMKEKRHIAENCPQMEMEAT